MSLNEWIAFIGGLVLFFWKAVRYNSAHMLAHTSGGHSNDMRPHGC